MFPLRTPFNLEIFGALPPPLFFLKTKLNFDKTSPFVTEIKKSKNNCLLGFTKIGENENVENLEKQSLLF